MNATQGWDRARQFLAARPDIEVLEILLADLNAELRGKWLPADSLKKVFDGGFKLPLSTLAFDIWGRDNETLVFEHGDRDGIGHPAVDTLVAVPWRERPTAQLIVSLHNVDGTPCAYDPRMALAAVLERLAGHGLRAVIASELEFGLFEAELADDGSPRHSQTAIDGRAAIGGETYSIEAMEQVGELLHAIREACQEQALPVDTLITEAAPSQYEINLYHQADALLAADQTVMLKRAIKGVAQCHGKRASFMAKPFAEQAGNGMHMHCSLVDESGRNVLADGSAAGSEMLRQAVAGSLATMADCMAIFAPNLNSYRRFRAASHAPLAATWGYENRTAAVRIPGGDPAAMRLEHRVCGADANPYLAIAALLAGMLHGIEQKLQPPAPVVGDAYSQYPPDLPRFWPDALRRFEASEFIGEYFGAEFRRVFALCKQQELEEFVGQVSPVEYDAYL